MDELSDRRTTPFSRIMDFTEVCVIFGILVRSALCRINPLTAMYTALFLHPVVLL